MDQKLVLEWTGEKLFAVKTVDERRTSLEKGTEHCCEKRSKG